MVALIAWRNVWRHKGRSAVVIGSMVLGIWAMAFGGGFMRSFLVGYIESSIKYETSNGQIHHPEFTTDYDIHFTIDQPEQVVNYLETKEEVENVTVRSIVNGMISSSRKATGVKIIGVDPDVEAEVTQLNSLISEGEYFTGISTNPVLIGNKLADELRVSVRSKVVLTFQDADGNITAGQFRVAGILEASSLTISEGAAYVIRDDLNRILSQEGAVHEIAYTTVPENDDDQLADALNVAFPNLLAESWSDLSPSLVFMEQWMASSLKVLIIIIMAALAFGIVNTMLMAVLERVRELGVLMALGMKRGRIFLMIMIETILLTVAGGPLGLAAGYATISYLGNQGIDLTNYSEGLESYGYSSILYPVLGPMDYLQIVVGVIVTAFLASIYPAWKAIQLNPVEAIHTV